MSITVLKTSWLGIDDTTGVLYFWDGTTYQPFVEATGYATQNDVDDALDAANDYTDLEIADLNLASGTYTPTITNIANMGTATPSVCQYMRVGNTVTVSGKITIDPTLTATQTQVGISLPIASNFASDFQCSGSASTSNVTTSGAIYADGAGDKAILDFVSASAASQSYFFHFTYLVI